ncbi:YegP family protein, partial [Acinetobacter baumannii]|uniref:YegP family protein n=1 Tax=Acinetobacter baumannii TaxID=470 RepID=UPI0011C4DD7D
MAGWYEITQANYGQYRFVLNAGNGEIILNIELYKAKASAVNGIESVQKNSID